MWRFRVKPTQMMGPPMVPKPRMRVSSGCAYSAVIAKGAVKSEQRCHGKSAKRIPARFQLPNSYRGGFCECFCIGSRSARPGVPSSGKSPQTA
jgi:hypothetical protein